MHITITPCTDLHFEAVKQYIAAFDLDDRQLQQYEFLIALHGDVLAGFGRVREHADCSEMCSLGIVEGARGNGIGKRLAAALVQKAKQPLYLVCIIPGYFGELGFYISNSYPDAIAGKLAYCTEDLPVAEAYVVMQRLSDPALR